MKEKKCKSCGESFMQFNSLQNLCDECQYEKALTANNSAKRRHANINHRGKRTIEWLEIDRPKWIKNHPPSHEGYWECYLQLTNHCRRWLTIDYLTLDHVKARSSNPAKRRRQQNLRPACINCNHLKGSHSLKWVIEHYPHSKVAREAKKA